MVRPARQVAQSSQRATPSKVGFNNDLREKAQRRRSHAASPQRSPMRSVSGNTVVPRAARKTSKRLPSTSLLDDDEEDSAMYDSENADPETPARRTSVKTAEPQPQARALAKQAVINRRRSTLHEQPHTPQQIALRDEDVPSNLEVHGTAITPMKKLPILANFEDWLKLATDNKINASNSWNFALIDYFHDMSLLKNRGGEVDFARASCTLDGCVKIYTGRVDSTAVEAGRLLSGLATGGTGEEELEKKKRKKGDGEDEEEEEGAEGEEDDEDGQNSQAKKQKKKKTKSHEATLAPSFASLQLKKLELEFAVDPLFKKASADFDEGGAKGLLLNHLSINSEGRIVFDSSDDIEDDTKKPSCKDSSAEDEAESQPQTDDNEVDFQPEKVNIDIQFDPENEPEIDLDSLQSRFFPSLSLLDDLQICPSMSTFRLGDPLAKIPQLKSTDSWRHPSPQKSSSSQPPQIPNLDLENIADASGLFLDGVDFDADDGDADIGGFDLGPGSQDDQEIGFGEGGEVWAAQAVQSGRPLLRPVLAGPEDEDALENLDADGADYALTLQHRAMLAQDTEQDLMLAFFGKAFNSRAKVGSKAFSNLTNWRIAKLQKQQAAENQNAAGVATRQRKEKEALQIDFAGPMSANLRKLLAAEPVSNSVISLPKGQMKIKGKNLLDKSDEVIDVKALMRLWTKPKCRIVRRRGGIGIGRVVDEGFGARRTAVNLEDADNDLDAENEFESQDGGKGDYDANFFADDGNDDIGGFDGPLPIDEDSDDDNGDGGVQFMDAREMLSPPPQDQQGKDASGQQLQASLDDMLAGSQPPGSQSDGFGLLAPPASQIVPGSFGSQLVTQAGKKIRPEYVNYARTAKKVDVRVLKENMWKNMSMRLNVFGPEDGPRQTQKDPQGDMDMSDPIDNEAEPATPKDSHHGGVGELGEGESLKFTQILGNLKNVYAENDMKDISTSYGFICLLHLANEKGLLLEGGRVEGSMNEIMIRRDEGVGVGYEGE